MADAETLELDYGWRATLAPNEPGGGRWLARLHPGPRPFGDVVGMVTPLWRALSGRGAEQVVVDMREVELLSSSLMGELVRLRKRLAQQAGDGPHEQNAPIELWGLRPACAEAIRVCRLEEVLPTAPGDPPLPGE